MGGRQLPGPLGGTARARRTAADSGRLIAEPPRHEVQDESRFGPARPATSADCLPHEFLSATVSIQLDGIDQRHTEFDSKAERSNFIRAPAWILGHVPSALPVHANLLSRWKCYLPESCKHRRDGYPSVILHGRSCPRYLCRA